jgi:hypothetical protein
MPSDKFQYQLEIITAMQQQRAVECRSRDSDELWIPVDHRQHFLNFATKEYRVAPVRAECWLVYDHKKQGYTDGIWTSGNNAAAHILAITGEAAEDCVRYEPIRMVPHHG